MLVDERKSQWKRRKLCCPDRGEQVSGMSGIQETEELRLFKSSGDVATRRVRIRAGRQCGGRIVN